LEIFVQTRGIIALTECRINCVFALRSMPRDPSYTSGNETSGGAAGEILAFFFPQDAATIRAEAAGGGV
jgi:hypothetical protein